jgi:serine/threonine protein kinase
MLARKYEMDRFLGRGKFGTVYKATHHKTGEAVAIKMESVDSGAKILKSEAKILKYLYDRGCRQVPLIHWFGIHNRFLCLALTYYECSLIEYDYSTEKLDRIMANAIFVLESIHTHYVLHRDIKPGNWMVKEGELFLIDFGLATYYLDGDGDHILDRDSDHGLVGTPKYASFWIEEGHNYGRRDDLISLGYMFLHMHIRLEGGDVPWAKNPCSKTRAELKRTVDITQMGEPIRRYIDYCYRLGFSHDPNYRALAELFVPVSPK